MIIIIETAVSGPLSFGVFPRYVAVPHDFTSTYDSREQALALAHECAHHARGDLVANWVSLTILAAHWWNPICWAAIRAFRQDQEFAIDAHVLSHSGAHARTDYARALAKAAGIGAMTMSNLNARSNLKGRLIMLNYQPLPNSRRIIGGSILALFAATGVAATVSLARAAAQPIGRQAVTIGVKPDGAGGYGLLVGGVMAAAGTPLPNGTVLPPDFTPAKACDLKPSAKPIAMVIKGSSGETSYSVMCASANAATIRATLVEGLASLATVRGMVATQASSPQFPEAERRQALGAIDRSISEVEGTVAKIN